MAFYFKRVGDRLHDKFKRLILLKWDSFVLSLATIAYGLQLFTHPKILESYEVYQLIDGMFDQRFISLVFVLLGFLKLVGILINNRKLKRVALSCLTGFWVLFAVSFLLSEPPNTIWIFSTSMALLSFGIALKES